MMAAPKRTPAEEADRHLGKAINHSSHGRRGDAAMHVEKALDAHPDIPYNAWSQIQAAKCAEGPEFRRYLREARQFIEGARDALEAEGSE